MTPVLLPLCLFQPTHHTENEVTSQNKKNQKEYHHKEENRSQDILVLALSILDENHKQEEPSIISNIASTTTDLQQRQGHIFDEKGK